MIHGSCKCQAVTYVCDASDVDFGVITVCHCVDCRKLQGGAGVIAAPITSARVQWTGGRNLITEYESSPGKKRAFCSRCGTPLYSRRDAAPEVLRLRMGSIDTVTAAKPVAHIFCGNLPEWDPVDLDLPRHARHEPGRG